MTVSRDYAEEVAIAALSFLARDPDALGDFVDQSGISPEAMRRIAPTDLYAGVMGFLVSRDALIPVFARGVGITPDDVMAAAAVLSPTEQSICQPPDGKRASRRAGLSTRGRG